MKTINKIDQTIIGLRNQKKYISQIVLAFYVLSPNVLLADALISAANSNGPEFVTSVNGTTVVNINKATAGGVSRNDYNTFNVSDKGLILNNSANIVNTTLAGHIDGNARLQGNSASIILNEVLGGSASNLNGYTEVAGQAAEVIIANQSGITCNGCGFINTPRGVLTTGQLQFEASDFSGYNVTQGQISIEGEGLNAANIDQVDLLARSISLNGKVWADKLNAITGQNTIAHDNLEILSSTSSVNNQPDFSLDVSALGGMYANRIHLIGTEDGLGVNSAGDLVAINKLQIDQSGKITNSGTIGTSDLEINATELSNNQNAVISAALSQLDIENELINEGTIKGEAITIDASNVLNRLGGSISSDDSIVINAKENLINSNAVIESSGNTKIETKTLVNEQSASLLSITGELDIDVNNIENSAEISADHIVIDTNVFVNSGAQAQIQTSKNLTLNVKESDLVNANGALIYSGNDLIINAVNHNVNNQASIQANNNLTLNTVNLSNSNTGALLAHNGLIKLDIGSVNNRGQLLAKNIDIDTNQFINNSDTALIQASEILDINVIDNDIENLNGATLLGYQSIILNTTQAIKNIVANIQSVYAATLTALSINNDVDSSITASSGTLTIKAETGLINNKGLLMGRTATLTSQTLENTGEHAQIQSANSLTITTTGDIKNSDNAFIYSADNADLTSKTGNIYNQSANIETDNVLTLIANTINNTKSSEGKQSHLVSSGNMIITGSLRNESSVINSLWGLTQKGDTFYNDANSVFKVGSINTTGKIADIDVNSWTNYGFIGASNLDIDAKSINNEGDKALVLAYEHLDMKTTGGDLNNKGGVLYSFGGANFDVSGTLLNESSYVEAVNELFIRAKNLINKKEVLSTVTTTNYYSKTKELPMPAGNEDLAYLSNTLKYIEIIETPFITKNSADSYIVSGSHMSLIMADNIENEYSTISSGGDLYIEADSLINTSIVMKEKFTETGSSILKWKSWDCDNSYLGHCDHHGWYNHQAPRKRHIRVYGGEIKVDERASVTANGVVNGNLRDKVVNKIGVVVKNRQGENKNAKDPSGQLSETGSPGLEDTDLTSKLSVDLSNQTLDELSNGALFSQTNNSDYNYLIETNPNFTEYENFISSDYMLEKMGVDINESRNVRLGDGYFEQDLVRDQILDLTGMQFLDDNQAIQDQYLHLMNNGIDAKDDFKLSFGVALTAEQNQNLSKPIVWMVAQEFETENGMQSVLVPKVYFTNSMAMLLREDGALIGGDSIDLKVQHTIANSGTIKANQKLALSAKNIISSGTLKSVETINLVAQQDIINNSGLIDGANVFLNAGRDFTNETKVEVLAHGNGKDYSAKQSIVGNTATINASNLSILAGNNINFIASQLQVKEDLVMQAANNIKINTAKIIEQAINGNYYSVSSTEHMVTKIGAGTVLIKAGETFTAEGAILKSNGDLSVNAKAINLLAVKNKQDKDIFNNYGGGNTEHIQSHSEQVLGTQLNSIGVLRLNADSNITSKGSQLTGAAGIALNAGENIVLATEQAFNSSRIDTTSKKSGFGGSTRISTTTIDESLAHTGTSLNSDANIIMTSGSNIRLIGSNVYAGQYIGIDTAGSLLVAAAVDESFNQYSRIKEKTFTGSSQNTGSNIQQAVASNLNANGTMNINIGGNVSIVGSNLTAVDTLTIGEQIIAKSESGQAVKNNGGQFVNNDGEQVGNVTVTTQELTNETWNETSSGLRGVLKDLASGLTLMVSTMTAGALDAEIEVGRSTSDLNSETTQKASTVQAINLGIDIKGNVAIIGSDINVLNQASVNANSLTLDGAKEQSHSQHSETVSTVSAGGPSLGESEVTVASLSSTDRTERTTIASTTWKGSTLNAGSLSVNAVENVNIVSSDVNVTGEAHIAANDIIISGRQDTNTNASESEKVIETVSLGVKNAYADTYLAIDALNSAKNAVRDTKQAYDDAKQKIANGKMPVSQLKYFEVNMAAATANVANASIAVASAGATAFASTGTAGFYATGSASIETNKSSSTTTDKTWNGSNVNIGGSANITADNEIKIKGSGFSVAEHLQLDAKVINLLAGDNSSTSSSESSSHTESASVSIKAPETGGTSFSGNLNASETKSKSESNYYTNSQIVAGTLSSDSKNLTLSGANVDAGAIDITTENLLVESMQNTAASNSETVSINAGFGKDGLSSAGINQQESNTSSAWVDQQSAITGGNVNITAKHTTLKGGVIAAYEQQVGNDVQGCTNAVGAGCTGAANVNLNFATDTLSVENIQDHDTSSDKGINLSHSFDGTNAHEKNNPPKASNDKMSTASTTIGGNYNGHDTRQTTSATLGNGNVTVGGQDIADTNIEVNRDIENAQEITQDYELGGLDASVTVDHRLASEEGREQIAKEFDETGILMQEVDNVMPSADNENQILAGLGETLNLLSTITGGIIPSDKNEGGLLSQIPILLGQGDIKHEVIGEGNKVFANGIMNDLEDAMQGAENIIGDGDKQIWWNPSRGILSDLLESGVDLLNVIGLQTGISKQAEAFQAENEEKDFYLHSQAHLIFKEGASNTERDHFYNSYGSPLPINVVKEKFKDSENEIGDVQQNEGDYVAHPLNIFNPSTWSKPGHGTVNYGAARDKKFQKDNL